MALFGDVLRHFWCVLRVLSWPNLRARDEHALIVRPVAIIIGNYKLPDFEPAELQEQELKPIDSIDFIGRIEAVPCYRTFGRTGD